MIKPLRKEAFIKSNPENGLNGNFDFEKFFFNYLTLNFSKSTRLYAKGQ
jgi:hypothetical protein